MPDKATQGRGGAKGRGGSTQVGWDFAATHCVYNPRINPSQSRPAPPWTLFYSSLGF